MTNGFNTTKWYGEDNPATSSDAHARAVQHTAGEMGAWLRWSRELADRAAIKVAFYAAKFFPSFPEPMLARVRPRSKDLWLQHYNNDQ